MSGIGIWVRGARPRTLGAGIAPVVVGSLASPTGTVTRFVLCLAVGLGLQIAVNYANDAADGARGIDQVRIGPPRLVSSGAASMRAVWIAATIAAFIGAAAGLVLAILVDPRLLVFGVVSLLALIGYSAGPRPYASLGLGEVVVFLFFGPIATVGTAFAQSETLPTAAWWVSVPMGLLAVAIMLANNIRDRETDAASGKRTLPVRIGDRASRRLYRFVVLLALILPVAAVSSDALPLGCLIAVAAAPIAIGPVRAIGTAAGLDLIRVLAQTAMLHAQVSLGLAIGLWFA